MFGKRALPVVLASAAALFVQTADAVIINIYDTDADMFSIADAQAVIDTSSGPDAVAHSSTIWLSDVGTDFGYGAGAPFPGASNTTFVAEILGTVDTDLYSYLFVAHDDGVRLNLDDTVLYEYGAPTDLLGSPLLDLGVAAGIRSFAGIFYENAGEADLFLLGWRRGADTIDWEIARIGDPISVPEPSTLTLLGLGLLAFGAAKRRRVLGS